MTLTQALTAAIRRELEARKGYLDQSRDLQSVEIAVRFDSNTGYVKAVTWAEERRISSTARDQAAASR